MRKNAAPPVPSRAIVAPAENWRSLNARAIGVSSRLLRSEKSGTRWTSSTGAPGIATILNGRERKETVHPLSGRASSGSLALIHGVLCVGPAGVHERESPSGG